MQHHYSVSKSSKAIVNFALLFFWISSLIGAYMFLVTVFALITGQAVLYRAGIGLIGTAYFLFLASTMSLPIVNQYNRIRVAEEGLYVEVYAFRFIWKLVRWEEILEVKLLPILDRWRKPQWLLRVKNLTYWHRWISWYYRCGSDPGIVINSDLINGDALLNIIDEKLSEKTAEASE